MKQRFVRVKLIAVLLPFLLTIISCGDDTTAPLLQFDSPPELYAAAHGDGITVVVGLGPGGGIDLPTVILATANGVAWIHLPLGLSGSLHDVVFAEGKFVAVGRKILLHSPDGIRWSGSSFAEGYWFHEVVYGNGLFVATGHVFDVPGQVVAVSTDGINWTVADNHNFLGGSITFGGGRFVAWGLGRFVQTSVDGISWETVPLNGFAAVAALVYADGAFKGMGYLDGGSALSTLPSPVHAVTSNDGLSWSVTVLEQVITMDRLWHHDGRWFGASFGTIYSSTDRITWDVELQVLRPVWDAVTHGDMLIMVGWGTLITRKSAFDWIVQGVGLENWPG